MKTYNEFLRDYLENLSDDELIEAWNEYCYEYDMDNIIYYNDEDFFETYFATTDDAIRAAFYGDYRYMDTYVVFNGYANLDSFNSYNLKEHIYIDEIVDVWESNGFLLDEYELIKRQEQEA